MEFKMWIDCGFWNLIKIKQKLIYEIISNICVCVCFFSFDKVEFIFCEKIEFYVMTT